MRQLLIFSCLLFAASTSLAQDYLWPTDASRWMTSSFAETRPRRMHAAIDIKTWNRTGYKVFAVRDGYIQRIRVSPFGYGKVIYQKLDTGEIALYAHLDGFNPELEAYVARQQEKSGKYSIDRYLTEDAFPVKKGDVLAYTGETGIGVPHLHFEMRDAQNRPFNPLLKGYAIDDDVAPILTGFAVLPVGFGSRVNDDFRPVRYSLQSTGRNSYRINETFSFEGDVGLALKCYDVTNEGSNRFHAYQIQLLIDGQLHYTIQYDKFSYSQNKYVQLERDYRLERQGYGRYVHLFDDPENHLSFYASANPAKGMLSIAENGNGAGAGGQLAPGMHSFEIIAKDYFGNSSTITGNFVAGKWLRFKPDVAASDSLVLLAVKSPQPMNVASLEIWQNNTFSERNWTLQTTLRHENSGSNHFLQRFLPLTLSARRGQAQPKAFRFLAQDADGVASWPAFYVVQPQAMNSRNLSLNLQPEFFDDYVRVFIEANMPLTKKPFIELTHGDGSTLYPEALQKSLLEFVLVIPQKNLQGRNVRILAQAEGVSGQMTASEISFENHRIAKGAAGQLTSRDGLARVSFDRNSLYRDLYGRIELKERHERLGEPRLLSHVYTAAPQDVPLNGGALVTLAYPDSVQIAHPKQLGVYYRVGRSRWIFIDNRVDTVNKEVSAKVLSLEDFAVGIDNIAPTVTVRSPSRNQSIRSTGTIRVYARDRESGFASEESLVLKIDGQRVIAEYDPEHGLISYTPRQPLAAGSHQLDFSALDRCGNETTVRQTFTVSR